MKLNKETKKIVNELKLHEQRLRWNGWNKESRQVRSKIKRIIKRATRPVEEPAEEA
jgi:hypothetical protein